MKKSKIVKIQFTKTWNGEKGTVYYHDVEFENGDKGQCGFNSECPAKYEIGTEHDYELTPNGNYPAKIKFVTPKTSGGGFSKPANNAGFALSYAKDCAIASWQPNSKAPAPLNTDQMLQLADKMLTWLESKKA